MGHVRLGYPPRTREWKQVIKLMNAGANAGQVATAGLRAIEKGLQRAADDRGVVATVRLLLLVPQAARQDQFHEALAEQCGICVPERMTFADVLSGFSEAVDAALPNNRGRTDLGEMAQMAGVESLATRVGTAAESLFGTTPEQIRSILSTYTTVKNFGLLARFFFARFAFKVMDYYLSRVAADKVGEGQRFSTLAEYAEFSDALEDHCHETATHVEVFGGKWASKARYESGGRFDSDEVSRFIAGAVAKMLDVVEPRKACHAH